MSFGPFNPLPEKAEPTSVQIDGRLIVSTAENAVTGALVAFGDCFWDTTAQRYVTPTGRVIGRYPENIDAYRFALVQAAMGLIGFTPEYIAGGVRTTVGIISTQISAGERASESTATLLAAGLTKVLGQKVSVVNGQPAGMFWRESVPFYRLRFTNGAEMSAAEAAHVFSGDTALPADAGRAAKEFLEQIIATRVKGAQS